MTIAVPIVLPTAGPGTGHGFEVQRVDFQSGDAKGRVYSIGAGQPLWRMDAPLASALPRALSDQWRATFTLLRGSGRLFFGYDYTRRYPLAYPTGVFPGGWSGNGGAWFQGIDGTTGQSIVYIDAVPIGLVINTGDYFSLQWGTWKRSLHRFMESGVAASGGTGGTGVLGPLAIEPPISNLVPSGATPTLAAPDCLMRRLPETDEGKLNLRLTLEGARLVAVQDLVP